MGAGAVVTPGTVVPTGAEVQSSAAGQTMSVNHADGKQSVAARASDCCSSPFMHTTSEMVAAHHAGEIWAGRPAKLLRKLEEEEMAFICRSADNYAVLAADHAIENAKTFPEVGVGLGSRLSSCRCNWQYMHGAVDDGDCRVS